MKSYIASGEGVERLEKIPLKIYSEAANAVKAVAREIADLIRSKTDPSDPCVLGLATGASPIDLYKELVRMHKEEKLSFKNVVTFNLDEYYPMPKESSNSYHYFMHHHLFNHIDIPKENIHIPDGTLQSNEVKKFCKSYEAEIDKYGRIDIQVLGIGRTGHIGFNEPNSSRTSQTRKVFLNDITIRDAIKDFGSREHVPISAITMGVSTIFKAKRIILLAWGGKKAPIIQRTVEGQISDQVPATYLQEHQNVDFFIDEEAASMLTRATQPWLVSSIKWTEEPRLVRQAVIHLCQKLKKPILKLSEKDYIENGLESLIRKYDSGYDVNIRVFNDLQHTITGWPGGKPDCDDSTRPVKNTPFPKKVLIFSPHPDDDVISMGGTFSRLVTHGHEVHTCYQTSGSVAVSDDYLLTLSETALNFTKINGSNDTSFEKTFDEIRQLIDQRTNKEVEPTFLLPYKALVRRSEAIAACRYLGVPKERCHFLNLPFYETGTIKKNPLTQEDVDIIVNKLREIKPNQIYCAGDLADPHGTHASCLRGILMAFDVVMDEDWFKTADIFWYRGAWMEWPVHQVDMAVPLSPEEALVKRNSIYKHGSQNNNPAFPGDDPREFWQRARDRNAESARMYDALGLAEYEAIECFARYIHKKGNRC